MIDLGMMGGVGGGGGGLLSEYFAANPGEWNAEWHGANPEEHLMRRYREASAWKRNQLDIKAQRDAEIHRQRMEKWRESQMAALQSRKEGWQRQFDEKKHLIRSGHDKYRNFSRNLHSTYQQQLGADASHLQGALGRLLGAYDTAYSGLDDRFTQSQQRFDSLIADAQQAANDFGGEAQRLQMPEMQMYSPNIYEPDIMTMLSDYAQVNPLWQQGYATLGKTYGDWNQPRIDEIMGVYQPQMDASKQAVLQGLGNFSQYVEDLGGSLGAGIYNVSDYNQQLAAENNINQDLRQMEQGILSQISNMFNLASTFANSSENLFNTERSQRLGERGQIQAQQVEADLATKQQQVEQNAAQQTSSRRRQTEIAFDPANILSFLTRGT